MFPNLTTPDHVHEVSCYAVLSGDNRAAALIAQNCTRLIFGKLGASMLGTTKVNGALFGMHIRNVVGLGAKKQMGRVYAPRVVAPMKNLLPIGNVAMGDNPCEPVRFFVVTVPSHDAVVSAALRATGSANPKRASVRRRARKPRQFFGKRSGAGGVNTSAWRHTGDSIHPRSLVNSNFPSN